MDDFSHKKLSVIRIYEILSYYSDAEHKLTHARIARYLKQLYGLDCDRKTISRNMEYLRTGGYGVVSDRDGSYLDDRKFEYGELRILIDSVLSNRYISEKQTSDLIKKLIAEGGSHFKDNTRHIVKIEEWQKNNVPALMLYIEIIDSAIENKHRLSFCYNAYGADKKLHPRSDGKYFADPYKLVIHNQKYYLIARSEKYNDVSFFRLDLMTDLEETTCPAVPVEAVKGYENGLNLGKITNTLPYMFGGKIERITFDIETKYIGHVVDWFGDDFTVMKTDSLDTVRISLRASETAMEYWLLQYGKHATLISPASLADRIREDILGMCKRYGALSAAHSADD